MHNRIKMVREKYSLNQTEFANRLEIKQSTFSANESGARPASDRTISAICREFNINENWLRTGDGEMLSKPSADPLDALCAGYNLSKLDRCIIKGFLELRSDQREMLVILTRRVFGVEDSSDSGLSAASFTRELMPDRKIIRENPESSASK